jgi:omega-6 fatty acid desaturase (delta-12 desaturase)
MPTAPPPFTIGTLRKAVPAHCFERSLARSLAYLAVDLVAVACLVAAAVAGIPALPALVRPAGWALYWWLQGAVMTGIW